MKIFYSPHFIKNYKSLPKTIQAKAEKKEIIFRKDPFNQRLKTHKLTGKFSDFWSFSVDYTYRIVFEFQDKHLVVFHKIGNHSVYK